MTQEDQGTKKKKTKARELLDQLDALEEISNKRRSYLWSISATLLATLTAGILTFMTTTIESPRKSETSYEVFKKAAIASLNRDSLSLNNAELLFQGATSKLKDAPDLMVDLRKALVKLNLEITKENNPSETDNNIEWPKKIRSIISEIDEVSPYHGLPSTERNIIEDINLLNQDNNVKSKLDQLAVLIGARIEELEKTQSQARWSLILAVAGIAGTFVSVFISITQVFRKRVRDIPEIQVKNLSIT